jgi:Ca2+-binding RTX toxin-like protein
MALGKEKFMLNRPQNRLRMGLLTSALVSMLILLGLASPAYAAINCVVGPGVTQTETTVTGSSGNDTIDCGGAEPGKTINGLGGDDTVTGTKFVDTINGGDGNDTLTGAIGDDLITGGLGNDTATGSAGNDTLYGGAGNDTLTGSEGNDTLNGEANDDTLTGGVGNDTINGGIGLDILKGGAGNDNLTGPPLDGSSDDLNGGADADVCARSPLLELFNRDSLTNCNP